MRSRCRRGRAGGAAGSTGPRPAQRRPFDHVPVPRHLWNTCRRGYFFYGQIRLRHRRRGVGPGQGHHRRLHRAPSQEPRPQGRHPEDGPLHQRRPGHHEPPAARRGVRHQRRRRDRPGPGPLRALHRRRPQPDQQRHHRPHLPGRHREGAAGRLPGRHGAGDPPHHQRDQGADPPGGRGQPGRRGHRRDRRHRGRHREPAVPGGHPPAAHRPGPRRGHVHPRHPGALRGRRRRGQDQAYPALGEGTAQHRHLARRHRGPHRAAAAAGDAREDRHVLRRGPAGRDRERRRGQHLRGPAAAGTAGPRRHHRGAPAAAGAVQGPGRVARDGQAPAQPRPPGPRRPGGQVRGPARRLPQRGGGLGPRRHRPRRPRRHPVGQLRGTGAAARRGSAGRRRRHLRARRLRLPGRRGQDRGGTLCPGKGRAVPGAVPGHAVRRHRVRPQRLRPGGRQQHRVRGRPAAPGHRPDAHPAGRHPEGRDHAPGRVPVPPGARVPGAPALRRRRRHGTAPPPLRGQQPLPGAAGGGGAQAHRHLARGRSGGDRRAGGASLLHRDPVPPRVPVAPQPPAPAVCGVRGRRPGVPAEAAG